MESCSIGINHFNYNRLGPYSWRFSIDHFSNRFRTRRGKQQPRPYQPFQPGLRSVGKVDQTNQPKTGFSPVQHVKKPTRPRNQKQLLPTVHDLSLTTLYCNTLLISLHSLTRDTETLASSTFCGVVVVVVSRFQEELTAVLTLVKPRGYTSKHSLNGQVDIPASLSLVQ